MTERVCNSQLSKIEVSIPQNPHGAGFVLYAAIYNYLTRTAHASQVFVCEKEDSCLRPVAHPLLKVETVTQSQYFRL